MALTLLEAAKAALNRNEVPLANVMQTYASTSDLMRVIPIQDISGNSVTFNREGTLPSVAFRNVNEGWTASEGKLDPVTYQIRAAGGYLDVDNYLVKTQGYDVRGMHEMMKVKALSMEMAKAMVKGATSSDPSSFNGLQALIDSSQLVDPKASPTSGGDVLNLAALDEVIDEVQMPTHLIMNKTMRRLLTGAARSSSVGGYISYTKDEFGNTITMYNDLPILIADEDSSGNQILPFTETGGGGGTAQCTSIYCVSMAPDGVTLWQNGTMDVRDMGMLEDKPVWRTMVEWYLTLAVMKKRAAARLRGLKVGAVTAVAA